MAKLYLTEYVDIGRAHGTAVPIADAGSWAENANSPIPIGGVSNPSVAFGANTTVVRVHCDVICSILITFAGLSATTGNARLAANQTEYFFVRPTQILSVIANT